MKRPLAVSEAIARLRAELRGSPALRSLAAVVWVAGVAVLTGFRVNVTRSLPLGLYFWDRSAQVERGAVVLACLPEEWGRFARRRGILGPGFCRGWTRPIGKRVLAMAGDTVELRAQGVTVNGREIPGSRLWESDSRGRHVPRQPLSVYLLAEGEVWLASTDHSRAFDSRYYGPVHEEQITAVVQPVLGVPSAESRPLGGVCAITAACLSMRQDRGIEPSS